MKTLKLLLLSAILLVCSTAFAATSNPSPASTGYQVVTLPIMGNYSSNRPAIVKFKAPFAYQVVGASATARDSSGASPTLTVNLKTGSTSIFSSPIAVTAGTISDAVLGTTKRLADEGTVSVDLAVGGTSPLWSDITVFLILKRL